MKRLLGNFSWIITGNLLSTLMRATALLLLVRLATPTHFALYAGVYGILVFGQALSDGGLTKLIIRERSLDISSKLHLQGLKINTLTSALLAVIGSIGLVLASIELPEMWTLVPMALTAALEKNTDTWRSVYLADGKAHLMSSFLMFRRLIALLLFVGLVYIASFSPVISMVIAELLAAITGVIAIRVSTRKLFKLPTEWDIGTTLRAARPYWIHGLAMHSRNLDVGVVGFFAPVAQSGYFAAATRLSGPLQLVPSAMASVLLPFAAKTQTRNERGTGKVILFTTILFVPVCLLLVILAPSMVPLLLGDDYRPAVFCIQLIILGLPLSVCANLLSAALQGEGFAKTVARISWVYAFVLLTSVAVGAHVSGAGGAAMGTLLANAFLVIGVIFLWILTRRRLQKGSH